MSQHTPGPWTALRAKTPSDTGWDYGIAVTINGFLTCIGEAYEVVGMMSEPRQKQTPV